MNLRQVRKKIKSIRNVKKITKAMQLISAIKMKKAQLAEVNGRPYRDTLTGVIEKILPTVDYSQSAILKTSLRLSAQAGKKKLIVFVSSNKGLCGAFHVNLHRFLLQKKLDFTTTDFITVGSKGISFVTAMGSKVLADYSGGKFVNEVSAIFSFLLPKFLEAEYTAVSIIYNKYISTFNSEPREDILLPFQWEKNMENGDREKLPQSIYAIEPKAEDIIDPLVKSYLEEKIRGALISSEAVEHASRMIAMKNATDNSTDIIYNLTLVGNKLRQEKITGELLDMITAKESVETN